MARLRQKSAAQHAIAAPPQATRTTTRSTTAWQIIDTEARGKCLQASRDIGIGERIIEELPLLALAAVPAELMDSKRWLLPDETANGNVMVKTAVSELSKPERTKFRRLHAPADDTDRDERDMGIVARNGFGHLEEINNLSHSITRVFHTISRINHSCRPNAMMDWNPALKKGTIHALAPIASGTEITIDYLNHAEDVLCSPRDRCRHLMEHYGFICTCEACGPSNTIEGKLHAARYNPREDDGADVDETELEKDQRLRLHAKWLLGQDILSVSDEDGVPRTVAGLLASHRARSNKLDRLDEYLSILSTLQLNDYKMMHAYTTRATLLQLSTTTEQMRTDRRAQAEQDSSPPEHYLQLALAESKAALAVQRRCAGPDHPQTEAMRKKTSKLDDEWMAICITKGTACL